jgi:hypothetical protein
MACKEKHCAAIMLHRSNAFLKVPSASWTTVIESSCLGGQHILGAQLVVYHVPSIQVGIAPTSRFVLIPDTKNSTAESITC